MAKGTLGEMYYYSGVREESDWEEVTVLSDILGYGGVRFGGRFACQ